jgi:hypothetical protein
MPGLQNVSTTWRTSLLLGFDALREAGNPTITIQAVSNRVS